MSRVDKLRQKMREKDLDAVLIYDGLNQHYLSGFAFTDGFLLITHSEAFLVTDFRYFEHAEKEAFSQFKVLIPSNRKEFVLKAFTDSNCKKVGFEGSFVSYNLYRRLCEDFSLCEFINIGDMVEQLRRFKDNEELKMMQSAQDITDRAFSALLDRITPDMTEIEVAAELEYLIRRDGASGLAFDTIAVSGDASSLPHGVPRNVKLKKGFFTLDFGAKYKGYCSDMTRTLVIGKADEEMKKLYNTVLSAQLAALDYLKPGVQCELVDKKARDIIESHPEYKGTFGHSLGHSVGLFIHESPRLSVNSKGMIAKIGDIYTVEPGIYLVGKYGCRIEDMVTITENGIYNFTKSTKELIEIC